MQQLFSYESWKSVFERILSFILVLVLSPLLIIIAIGIIIDSPGPPIFRQERVGKGGHKFILYKFRSMYVNHDDSKYHAYLRKYLTTNSSSWLENGQDVYELVHDPRVTRLGRFIRRTFIDELPQLINILKGEMSFIGPRPDIPFAVNMYQEHHKNRLRVKPGLTGLWQISGRRKLTFDEMVKMDVDYIERQSLVLDLKISLSTMREMILPSKVITESIKE
jgi:lipopolysaccharide/colanic/teichoic acid biosynthesis glycosyltransferase